jgi:hypothetical protein
MALSVPTPRLQQNGGSSPVLVAEKPIGLSCSPVLFPDGTSLTALNTLKANFLLYRQLFGGARQIWDDQMKSWGAPSPTVKPQSLFWNEKVQTWQSVIVAIGNKDSTNHDTFATDLITGFPKYMAQCFFSGRDFAGAQEDGTSPLSAPVTIFSPGKKDQAGLTMNSDDPKTATEIRIFLKDSGLTERGSVVITQDFSGFHVQLIAGGTSVVLSSAGEIVLTPFGGQAVQVNGDLAVSGHLAVNGIQVAVP